MNSLIKLENVGLTYKVSNSIFKKNKYFSPLKSINLEVYSGETLGIVGVNGTGKSSLLKILAGIIQPTSGKIINNGATVSLLSIGTGFDQNLSGADNVILSGVMQGESSREMSKITAKIYQYAELGEFLYQPLRTYSTGMRARLGFSIANEIKPDILLIDETLGVGDHEFRKKAEKTISDRINSNQTVVLVSHSRHHIEQLCQRAIILENGINTSSMTPKELFQRFNI